MVNRLYILLILVLLLVPASARHYTVSADCHRGKTVIGTRTRSGICAGPRQYLWASTATRARLL